MPLNIAKDSYRKFPIDEILIVTLPWGHGFTDELKSGLTLSINQAQRLNMKNIVIPSLAVRYDDHGTNSLSLNDFFKVLFAAVPFADHPDNVYLSIYTQWPTFEIELAMRTINDAWHVAVMDESGDYVINHRDIRLILLALFICLITCSFYVSYTLKTFLIISVSFIAFSVSATNWIDPLVAGGNPRSQLWVEIATLLVIAVAFPVIGGWSAKNLFEDEKPSP